MAIEDDLLDEITNVLGTTITPSLTSSSRTDDIYEGFIFSLIVKAAQDAGATISFRDVHGNIPTQFVFRTSPGFISSTLHPYTHAILEFPGSPVLEVHLGVRVAGSSKVLHECDVAVIHQSEAMACRVARTAPRASKVIIGVECKFYTDSVPLKLAREFIGTTSDFGSKGNHYFVMNVSGTSVIQYLSPWDDRKKHWEHNVIPSSNELVDRLRKSFEKRFANFVGKR